METPFKNSNDANGNNSEWKKISNVKASAKMRQSRQQRMDYIFANKYNYEGDNEIIPDQYNLFQMKNEEDYYMSINSASSTNRHNYIMDKYKTSYCLNCNEIIIAENDFVKCKNNCIEIYAPTELFTDSVTLDEFIAQYVLELQRHSFCNVDLDLFYSLNQFIFRCSLCDSKGF